MTVYAASPCASAALRDLWTDSALLMQRVRFAICECERFALKVYVVLRNFRLAASPDDVPTASLGMALFALCAGYAVHLSEGYYSPHALFWLTIAFVFCVSWQWLCRGGRSSSPPPGELATRAGVRRAGRGSGFARSREVRTADAFVVGTLQAERLMSNHHFS